MPSYRPTCDTWILARPKVKYYGAYPNGFLHRARELLGVGIQDEILHVCSGKIREYPLRGFGPKDKTVDLDPDLKPDFVMDVKKDLPKKSGGWKGILLDPPYSTEDAEHYKVGAKAYPQPNKLLKLALERVEVGRRVGFLHYMLPRPPALQKPGTKNRIKAVRTMYHGQERICQVRFVACISVIVGFGNRVRCFSVFEVEMPPEFTEKKIAVPQLIRPDVWSL